MINFLHEEEEEEEEEEKSAFGQFDRSDKYGKEEAQTEDDEDRGGDLDHAGRCRIENEEES